MTLTATPGADMSTQLNATSARALFVLGKRFVVRYLGTGDPTKALLDGEPAIIHAAGLNLCLVWEGDPTFPGYFSYSQGLADARAAAARAQQLGAPSGTAIYFAVDFDAQAGDMTAIAQYVRGLKSGIGAYKVGVYGGYAVMAYLYASEPVPYYWQTYGWSGGQVASFAQLYQYQNGVYLGGVQVDLDSAYTNPGWWSVVQPTGASVTGALGGHPMIYLAGLGMLGAAAFYFYKRSKVS